MGLKFVKAFGAHVVLFTSSPHKAADAVRLGADEVIMSTDNAAMQKHAGSLGSRIFGASRAQESGRHDAVMTQ